MRSRGHAARSAGNGGRRRNARSSKCTPRSLARSSIRGRHRAGMPDARHRQFPATLGLDKPRAAATATTPPSWSINSRSVMTWHISQTVNSRNGEMRLSRSVKERTMRGMPARKPQARPVPLQRAMGARLAVAIRALGVSKSDVADRCFVSHSALTNYLTGARPMPPAFLARLLTVYGISADYLLTGVMAGIPPSLRDQIALIPPPH